ncbi:MAG TPA: DUF362 domain-containing protein [Candidatus Acidoferrum sp.]|nr:DUF362 domain-containing protein [Candidatus Acidoferrum sp.]
MKTQHFSRRSFLQQSMAWAAGVPLASLCARARLLAAAADLSPGARPSPKVAIVPCHSYGPEVRPALEKCFDLLGGVGWLVKNKTVTVKLNLTGSDFRRILGRPVGETYMSHPASVMALTAALLGAGARRVRIVESTQRRARLEFTLTGAGWDVPALEALGNVEFENTRNLGSSSTYARLPVPGGGYMFSSFDLNRAYVDTDVLVSMAKLKNHLSAGVTLTMKNLFGLPPNSLYSNAMGNENATGARFVLHDPTGMDQYKLPALKPGITSTDPTWRVPRVTADVCAARPIHLGIIDGITAMSGGEGPWGGLEKLKFTTPGVLIAGFNPVSTDAVGVAVMGYENPRAARGTKPFHFCDNHLLLAEQAGLGTADLAQIDLRGTPIAKVRYPYA